MQIKFFIYLYFIIVKDIFSDLLNLNYINYDETYAGKTINVYIIQLSLLS